MKERTLPGALHYCGEPAGQAQEGLVGLREAAWGSGWSQRPLTLAPGLQPPPARRAGQTARWIRRAPGSPSTCGSSSKSCCSSPTVTAASSAGSTKRKVRSAIHDPRTRSPGRGGAGRGRDFCQRDRSVVGGARAGGWGLYRAGLWALWMGLTLLRGEGLG